MVATYVNNNFSKPYNQACISIVTKKEMGIVLRAIFHEAASLPRKDFVFIFKKRDYTNIKSTCEMLIIARRIAPCVGLNPLEVAYEGR